MGFLEETRTDTESYRQGMELFRRGNVQPGISGTDALCYDVGPAAQRVSLLASGEARCTCGAREQPCAHIVAATLAAQAGRRLRRFCQESELRLGEKMLGVLGRAMPGGESVRLTPALRLYEDGRAALGLSVGQERLYAVRNVADLLTCFALGAPLAFQGNSPTAVRDALLARGRAAADAIDEPHSAQGGDAAPAGGGRRAAGERPQGPQSDGRFVIMTGALCTGCFGI